MRGLGLARLPMSVVDSAYYDPKVRDLWETCSPKRVRQPYLEVVPEQSEIAIGYVCVALFLVYFVFAGVLLIKAFAT